jgi:hypothetical protein
MKADWLWTNAIMLVLAVAPSMTQQLPQCESEKVDYSAFDNRFADKMLVQPGPVSAWIVGDKQFSPQKTRWMIVSKPDYTKPGPWTTVVWIRNADRGVPEMLTFVDHASGGVSLEWLNEKLLYGAVSWGRIVSTDFIFDFEKKEFLYREMANYGQLTEPCR